ncbi:hypothetical protein LDO26_03085 [Luteimonas sp. BDR2-5]|uniref:hypothetical protein n=1 Tax=Proluteimonas luteida TaxID=2878685 RepID=UPI001E3759B0|nr:hypothetical protein [Luteimonas sp. BDR2-5]MCD9027198.1 hypothetical protein [Luteimonas sp. BDR2-5]
MSRIARPRLLGQILHADALSTGAVAVIMLAAAAPLAAWTALPAMLLQGVGVALLPFAAWLAWLARRPTRGAAAVVVAVNALYAIDCLALPLLGWVQPNALGFAFLLLQAVVVGGFAASAAFALGRAAHRQTAGA